MLSVNSVYLIAYILLQITSSYFSKMASVALQYKPVSLDVNKYYFEEEQDIPNTREKKKRY